MENIIGVFYKIEDKNDWRRPGVIIGRVNQQVFVEHGSFYICVHSSRLQLIKSTSQSSTETVSEQSLQYNRNHQNDNVQNQQTEIDNSSDSESNKTPPQNEHSIHLDMTFQ